MTKTLLHTCCAPCSVACIQLLRAEGIEPVSYWYNPNIHPYQEYKARRDTLMAYAPSVGVELIVQEDYGLRDFCRAVAEDIDHRCGHCYRLRLEETAQMARAGNFDYFTTTLSISPLKNAQLLNSIGAELAEKYGIPWLYSDFKKREGYKRSIILSKEYDLYRQNYCGCVFSKRDSMQRKN